MEESILLTKEYVLVLDTNSPSFEFANQLCAYCTGYGHEKSTDDSFVDMFYEDVVSHLAKSNDKIQENPFNGFVTDKMDQDGFYSPCTVWLNKKYGCNEDGDYGILTEENCERFSLPAPLSVGIYFENEPNEDHVSLIRKRAIKFASEFWKKPFKFEGMRLITKTLYGSERNLD